MLKLWFAPIVAIMAQACSGPLQSPAHDQGSSAKQQKTPSRIFVDQGPEWVKQTAGSVGALVHRASNSIQCSGSRIAKDLFMTNMHCQMPCQAIEFLFGFDGPNLNPENTDVAGQFRVSCDKLVAEHPDYDLTIYRFKNPESLSLDDYPIASLSQDPVSMGEELISISHEINQPKSYFLGEKCVVTDENVEVESSLYFASLGGLFSGRAPVLGNKHFIKHTCFTKKGSSGSPIFSLDGLRVVGLHYAISDLEVALDKAYYKASPMNEIVSWLKKEQPEIFSKVLVK
jgi:hypothetical protein